MKKISQIVSIALCGIFFSGCVELLYSGIALGVAGIVGAGYGINYAVEKSKKATAQEKIDCENFEGANLAKLEKDMIAYKSYKRNIKILDEKKGKLSNEFSDEFYCNVLEVTSTTASDKLFAVNGGGVNDFSVKVTKELYTAQKTKEGKVIEKDIKITAYSLEKVSGVYYDGYIYKPDSLYIKKMRNQHENFKKNLENNFRNNLPCFELNRKRYCDGDLVNIWGGMQMLRVVESGYGMVDYRLYLYGEGQPVIEASYDFMKQFKMNPPEVIGNHDLNRELEKSEVPSERTLRLSDIKTFKEW
ncbi:hypothetical protein [Helicobacter sp. 23-1045]